MNARLVLKMMGFVLMVEGALMAFPLLISLIMGGGDWKAIVLSMAIAIAVGFATSRIKPKDETLRVREGFGVVALSWIVLSFFGGLPFYFSGYIPSLIDCMFETVSGFTTTGATILNNVEALPKGLLFWRSFTHWAGGMGVLVLSLAILPRMGTRSIHLMRAESSGPSTDKLVPRVGTMAKILYKLYIGLSIIMFIILLLCGVNWYDSLVHMFGAAGTGGFSNYNSSVAHLANPAAEIVISIFLALFSISFAVYHRLLHKDWEVITRGSEWKVFLAILLGASALITINILPQYSWDLPHAMRASFFQASSIMSTAGFATENFDLWPQFSRTVLLLLMFVGGCAGSTAGGLKVIRVQLLVKSMWRDIGKTIRPRAVKVLKLDGKPVDERIISSTQSYFFAAIFIILMATTVVSLDGHDLETSLTSVLTTFFNVGPGLSLVGPIGNFDIFSPLSKIVLTLCMLLGRLEIFPILLLATPDTWRK